MKECPLKRDHFNRQCIFQALVSRDYVRFLASSQRHKTQSDYPVQAELLRCVCVLAENSAKESLNISLRKARLDVMLFETTS